jgi:hypothetical protein
VLDGPPSSREAALHTLKLIRERFTEKSAKLASLNEAATRLLLVDEILVALGWRKEEFNPEQPTGNAGYTDYLLSVDGFPRLVVEAKRTGHTFFSARKHSKTEYTLTYARSAFGSAFADVLDQAAKYAREQCVPFAILTNGAEWLLVQVIPSPGRAADDCKCFYFGNLLRDDANFELLWELLSFESVGSGKMGESLAEVNAIEADFSANPRGELGDFAWSKSLASNSYLDDFYFLFFDQIVDPGRRNMLEFCFVSSSRLDQYEGTLKRVLRDAAPKYLSGATELTPNDRDQILPASYGDQSGRVVLVTGSVGCGKSTFVTKVLVELRQRKTVRAVLVDLIDEVDEANKDIPTLLWRKVLAQWQKAEPDSFGYEELKKIFHSEIEILKRGARARVFESDPQEFERAEAQCLDDLSRDPETFLSRCLKYYRRHLSIGTAVFLDNVDRASEGFQKAAYFFAHKLASLTGATVIVPMREMTFFRGKAAGFLDIRSGDAVFHLQAPDLIQVLAKRIQYIESHLDDDPRLKELRRREDYPGAMAAYRQFSDALKKNLLASAFGQRVVEVLSAMAWHDVRSFLASLKQVQFSLGGAVAWELSSIIAPLMTLKDAGGIPRIPNLFRPPYPAYPCFFLKARIVAALLYSMGSEKVRQGISLPTLLGILRVYGYHDRWSRRAIEELVQERMLECLEAPAAAEFARTYKLREGHDSFRPSPLAVVLFETILFERPYLVLLGHDIAFQNRQSYVDYVGVIKELVEAVGGHELDVDSLSLLLESRAPAIIASYLSNLYFREQPVVDLSKYAPEVSAIETRLISALARIGVAIRRSQPETAGTPSRTPVAQLELLAGGRQDTSLVSERAVAIPYPPNIKQTAIAGSRAVPAIFWCLVAFKAKGKNWCNGAEITRLMNQHIFSDQERKEPTNISRALRSPVLRDQEWLAVAGSKGDWKYGLSEAWREEWRTIFGSDAPDIGDGE